MTVGIHLDAAGGGGGMQGILGESWILCGVRG